jgi:hypothetical protein
MQDKANLYKGLNLRLTYEHATGIIRAEAQLGDPRFGIICVSEGGIDPIPPHCSMSCSADLDIRQADGPPAL